MDSCAHRRTQQYVLARKQHPAWLLLASPRAPLVLGCLTSLFEYSDDGVAEEDALQALTEMLNEYALQDEYGINPDTTQQQAGRELREWIKRGLVIERGQRVYATDALSTAIGFIDSLDDRIMTSTASRLSVVQREIESLEVSLNPSPESRIAALRRRINVLEAELADAEQGRITVLSTEEAMERIREVFGLAMGLRADFRRVEDSWREADRQLRQSIMSDEYHRGDIIERLLDGQQALLNTPEGRVFDAFQQQLRRSVELDNMRQRLRQILSHPAANRALNRNQSSELRLLGMRLVNESQSVLQARARSEKDVKGFLKTGLASEHHRVGEILNDIFALALKLDWQKQKVRRADSPLPPIGFALGVLPIPQRLRFKSLEQGDDSALDLTEQDGDLDQMDSEFWAALEGLDREVAIKETLALLAQEKRPLSLKALADQLPPAHDLETFALWIGMAQEAGIEIDAAYQEAIELTDDENHRWRFDVPLVEMNERAFDGIEWEF